MSGEVFDLATKRKRATPSYRARQRKVLPLSERMQEKMELQTEIMRITKDIDFLARDVAQVLLRFMRFNVE